MPRLRKEPLSQKLWNQKILILMSVPFVIWLILFRYVPLTGWIMAFQDINASNIGIPGFWPHAALYLGRPGELWAAESGTDRLVVIRD